MQIKDIISRFEVTRATLHNWKQTKPNLFNLLKNSDDYKDEKREINIILEEYAKENIKPLFTFGEIEFVFNKNLSCETIDDIKKLSTIYGENIANDIKENPKFILDIYHKLDRLNIVEKYIFIRRLQVVQEKNIKDKVDKNDILKHYMKEFIV